MTTVISVVISILIISGCSSLQQPKEVYTKPDYTLEDVRNAELNRIMTMLKEKPVQALWHAYLVNDKKVIAVCTEKVAGLYKDSYNSGDYFTALRLYRSLIAVGYKGAELEGISVESLEKQCFMGVPGLNRSVIDSPASPEKMSLSAFPAQVGKYIKGTVTVWVDQGIKVQNGVGRADRVIGSGFFIDKNGYIVTNHHVISNCVDPKYEGYSRLFIKLSDDPDTRIPAKVIGWDSVLDLALLKAEINAPYVFTLGSSTELSVGDKVYAIGSPVGLERTLTSGIVSATDRKLFTTGSVFQIDAAVNAGNSGGPCIDSSGRVQAIVFAGMPQYQGLNFAIPVEYLETDLPMLYHGGKREHSWVAAYGHTGKEGMTNTGLEVQYVMPSGSAALANLTAGDIVTAVDGKKILTLEDLQAEMRRYVPDTIVCFEYMSGSETKNCLVYLDKRPEYPGYDIYQHDTVTGSFVPIFGMKLESVSTTNSRKFSITNILKGSIADESGFSVNDPVDIHRIRFADDNSALYAEIYAKNRKKGYLDISMALAAPLDSPYYF